MGVHVRITDEDLEYADARPIRTELERFVWNEQTYSKLGHEQFKEEGRYSMALESVVSRQLGLERKTIDDTMPDLPGVEVASCAAENWAGRPYLYSRVISREPWQIHFISTLTGFRVPGDERLIELRHFIEPSMLPLRFRGCFTRRSGITRWLVDRVEARAAGAEDDIWERLERAVHDAQEQLRANQVLVQQRNAARRLARR